MANKNLYLDAVNNGDEILIDQRNLANAYKTLTAGTGISISNGTISNTNVYSAGSGINISNGTITNQFSQISAPNLNDINYYYIGYVNSSTNYPSGANFNGQFMCVPNRTGSFLKQIYMPYNSDLIFVRYKVDSSASWSSWTRVNDKFMAGDTATLTQIFAYGYKGTNNVSIQIPFSKPIASGVSATFTSLTLLARGVAKVIIPSTNIISNSKYSISNQVRSPFAISLFVTDTSVTSLDGDANTPVSAIIDATITFS